MTSRIPGDVTQEPRTAGWGGEERTWAGCTGGALSSVPGPAAGKFTCVSCRRMLYWDFVWAPEFGSTLAAFEGEQCLGCAFFPSALLDAVANEALGLQTAAAAASSEHGNILRSLQSSHQINNS